MAIILTKLAGIMKSHDITDEWLAAKTMMSARSILNAKRGKGVSRNTGRRLAKVLKMSLEELI